MEAPLRLAAWLRWALPWPLERAVERWLQRSAVAARMAAGRAMRRGSGVAMPKRGSQHPALALLTGLSAKSLRLLRTLVVNAAWASAVRGAALPALHLLGLAPPGGHVRPNFRWRAPGRFVSWSFGHTHLVESGPSDGHPVVLLHGYSTPCFCWEPASAALARHGYHVIAYDLVGRGWSDSPDVPHTQALFVSQLAELLQALGLGVPSLSGVGSDGGRRGNSGGVSDGRAPAGRSVTLVGLSMGTIVAQAFAARFPDAVSELVLCSPPSADMEAGMLAEAIKTPVIGDALWHKFGHTQLNDYHDQIIVADARKQYAASFRERFNQCRAVHPGYTRSLLQTLRDFQFIGNAGLYEEVGQQERPTLLLWGTGDFVTPFADSDAMRRMHPKAEFVAFEGKGHWMVVEAAAEVADTIHRFLSRSRGARGDGAGVGAARAAADTGGASDSATGEAAPRDSPVDGPRGAPSSRDRARGPGLVVLLNGSSSAGKGTAASNVQEMVTSAAVVCTTVDTFMYMAPKRLFANGGTPDGFQSEYVGTGASRKWKLRIGEAGQRVMKGFRDSVRALSCAGNVVIADDVFIEEPGTPERAAHLRGWVEALRGCPTLLVGLRCDPDELDRREKVRGDRPVGSARCQAAVVHVGVPYDVDIDTTGVAPEAIARRIADAVVRAISGDGACGTAMRRLEASLGPAARPLQS